ncbi:hypothetical protein FKW77_008128 [Venturia effusa]|uniref:DNA-directed RNA polymerase subunit n=1 Tax=Venturia effusa TaxID=50376 RepID=A0A517L7S6_9PEZI|nr:hypothetical protein FKW77_008128 [Venturia effusa]
MNISAPVSDAITGVRFSALSSKEIKALSVKRIDNPTTFDTLLHPTPGGLYDAALGGFVDNRDRGGCPGHSGHIELPTRVYHPTYMDQCLRLLRGTCVYCNKLRMSRQDVNRYSCKLRLIHFGLLEDAHRLEEMMSSSKGKRKIGEEAASSSDTESDEDEEAGGLIRERNEFTDKAIKRARKAEVIEHNEALGEERKNVIRSFLADIARRPKCSNCGGHNPSYRKDKFVKIFRKPPTEKQKASNLQLGLRAKNPLVIMARRKRAEERALRIGQKDKPNGHQVDEAVADLDSDLSMDEISSEGEGDDLTGGQTTMGDTTSSRTSTSKKETELKQEYISANEVHATLTLLFENERDLMHHVYTPRASTTKRVPEIADMFFIDTLLVPPTRYRPEARTGDGAIAEASQNNLYRNIISICENIAQINREVRGGDSEGGRRVRNIDDLQGAFVQLQDAVNSFLDRDRNPIQGNAGKRNEEGVKQLLEKKEGLFRKNMMGKRVNFAARSVISPDPNIETNEIGVPPVFAMKLTYPEPVTTHNFYELKEAVLNGPEKWPGAVAIENENGQVINLGRKNMEERMAIANQLLAPSSTSVNGSRNKKVHRHLNNGDIVIMNRQPTLHKPSMMCHRARVLPGERTIRMHYANCNTYNADFDGDEMNMHFPQNEIARAEAMLIANTDNQYLSATAGKPLRGLIQDHISMGVQITNRDMFFNREEYQQLLYAAIRPESNHTTSGSIETIPPAIMKPTPLWTGKQVITTILKNIAPANSEGLNLTGKSTTNANLWGKYSDGKETEEVNVVIKKGYFATGILDKAQIGPSQNGVVNGVYEAHGPVAAGKFLSILGRLLTRLLHMRAFSCGVEDLILTREGDDARAELLKSADTIGLEVASEYVTMKERNPAADDHELKSRLERVLRDDSKQAMLDEVMKSRGATLSSDITKRCLPNTLVKPFPKNQMQAMTGSGAKGSGVNANQISCNLGQQVLEGRRVPIMVSGKSLPSFRPFDSSVGAGGYIKGRFLTGLKPQEYFFHMMSGREGLIDTAVKTSRSGYLQRCLIKGMEGLKVEYDTSVRDSDGSMIQFLYGEDGLDVTKQQYLTNFKFLSQNFMTMFESLDIRGQYERLYSEAAAKLQNKTFKKYKKTRNLGGTDPVTSLYAPSRFAGSTSERFHGAFVKYCEENSDKKGDQTITKTGENDTVKKRNFDILLQMKYLKSLVEPGEAVGVVAGQSIGEPSTQMTLNTFHLAGHSSKNVTLGIPRLREIVMTASAKIATPRMTLHPISDMTLEDSETFAKSISRLSLAEVVDKIQISETLGRGVAYGQAKTYNIKLDFFPADKYCEEYAITEEDVLNAVSAKLLPRLQGIIRKDLKKKGDAKTLKKSDALPEIGKSAARSEQQRAQPEADAEGGDEDSDDDVEADASGAKSKANRTQNVSYAAPDEEEQAIINQGLRETSPDVESDDEEQTSNKGRDKNKTTETSASPSSSEDESSDSDDEGSTTNFSTSKRRGITEKPRELQSRVMAIKGNSDVSSFKFARNGAYAQFSLEYAASTAKLLMLHLVEQCCHDTVIHAVPGIKACTVDKEHTYKDRDTDEEVKTVAILTEGINILAMREAQDQIDPHRIFTNDIAAVLQLYGVEAARATIVREMHTVFSGHGISVDTRHLNLIADVMTRSGGYKAFNRMGMRSAVSPFMKMSFETTVGYLRDAVLEDERETLRNPSARIVAGRLSGVGTGAFDVLQPVRRNLAGEDGGEEGFEVEGM